jgi:Protein of unknown function (DUF2934)
LAQRDRAANHRTFNTRRFASSPEEVKRKFNVNSAREDVVRQRAYEIYEQQHGREVGYTLDYWLQAEHELK